MTGWLFENLHQHNSCRPGLEPGSITPNVRMAQYWGSNLGNNEYWRLWVPAFAGTTNGGYARDTSHRIAEHISSIRIAAVIG
jgi:hypothetical protein